MSHGPISSDSSQPINFGKGPSSQADSNTSIRQESSGTIGGSSVKVKWLSKVPDMIMSVIKTCFSFLPKLKKSEQSQQGSIAFKGQDLSRGVQEFSKNVKAYTSATAKLRTNLKKQTNSVESSLRLLKRNKSKFTQKLKAARSRKGRAGKQYAVAKKHGRTRRMITLENRYKKLARLEKFYEKQLKALDRDIGAGQENLLSIREGNADSLYKKTEELKNRSDDLLSLHDDSLELEGINLGGVNDGDIPSWPDLDSDDDDDDEIQEELKKLGINLGEEEVSLAAEGKKQAKPPPSKEEQEHSATIAKLTADTRELEKLLAQIKNEEVKRKTQQLLSEAEQSGGSSFSGDSDPFIEAAYSVSEARASALILRSDAKKGSEDLGPAQKEAEQLLDLANKALRKGPSSY